MDAMTETIHTPTQKKRFPFTYGEKLVPLILLIITVITYVPLIKSLGFYWDDWPMLWFDVTQGPSGFAEAFTSDRRSSAICIRRPVQSWGPSH